MLRQVLANAVKDDERPLLDRMASLQDQFFRRTEFQQAARLEHLALYPYVSSHRAFIARRNWRVLANRECGVVECVSAA
jgi:hypothetical protein